MSAREEAEAGTAALKALTVRHRGQWSEKDRADIRRAFDGLRAVSDQASSRPALDDAELDEIDEEIREAR